MTSTLKVGEGSAGFGLCARLWRKPTEPLTVLYVDVKLYQASIQTFQNTPLWNAPSSKLMWDVYLKGKDRNNLPKYVSPLQRTDLKGLPPTFIETAEFDCLRDEGILYAQKLKETNIKVELNQTKGTIHAYDIIEKSSIVQESVQRRIVALRKTFGEQK